MDQSLVCSVCWLGLFDWQASRVPSFWSVRLAELFGGQGLVVPVADSINPFVEFKLIYWRGLIASGKTKKKN